MAHGPLVLCSIDALSCLISMSADSITLVPRPSHRSLTYRSAFQVIPLKFPFKFYLSKINLNLKYHQDVFFYLRYNLLSIIFSDNLMGFLFLLIGKML